MQTTFAQPVDDFSTTLASGHTSADGHLVLALSPGVLASGRVWRVTALSHPDLPNESVLGIFQATSSSGVTLSGVTAVEGTSDSTLASGTAVQIRMTALDLAEVQTALNTAETTIASQGTSISTLQTSLTADEATIASHTTELASHATSLATDATAITSLQTSRTTDEATLASHTTELASHAASLATEASAITALGTIEIPTVWWSGDSLSSGAGLSSPSTQSIVAQTAALLGAAWSLVNEGRPGYTAAQLATADLTLLDPVWSWQRPLDIVLFWAGTNDLYFGASAATTYANIVGYCVARRLAGRPVIVTTMLPRLLGSGSWLEADRQTVNGLIRANWPTFADELWDVAAVASIGAFGANLDATNYQADHTHLTAAGYALAAPSAAATILRLASRTIVQADGPNTFTQPQTFQGSSSQSSIRAGTLEFQSIGLNNCAITENAFNNGSGWVYRQTGTASLIYFVAGIVAFYTAPSGAAGTSVSWVESLAVNADSSLSSINGLTSASFATTGAGSGYVITRRDAGYAAAYQLFSAAGVLQVFSYAAGGVVATIDATGNLTAAGGFVEKMSFFFAQGVNLTNGTYPVGTVGAIASHAGKAWKWKLRAGTNPSGGAGGFSFDLKKNGTTILSAPIAVAANTTTLQSGNTFAATSFAEGDEFTVAITSAGTGVQNVSLILYTLVGNG